MPDVMDLIPRAGELVTEDLPQGSDAWLRARRTGIGGSEVAAILGLSPWSTPLTVWRTKKGMIEDRSTLRMRRGSHQEAFVRREWAEKSGAETVMVPFLRDAARCHRVASLDGIIVAPGTPRILEVKTSARRWDALPVYYEVQVRYYLAITGLAEALVVLDYGDEQELREDVVAADPELAGEMMQVVDAFWQDYVLADVEPPPQTTDERTGVALARLQRDAQAIVAPEAVRSAVLTLREAEAAKEALSRGIDEAKAQIAEAMAASGVSRFIGDGWTASMVERKGSVKYADVVRAHGIPQEVLDQYRGEASRYVTIRETRGGRE